MSYMLLMIEEPGERLRPPEAERRERYERMVRFAGELQSRGLLKTADALALPDKRGGARSASAGKTTPWSTGPFAEAKEIVGGFFYLDVETRDEAVAIAERNARRWNGPPSRCAGSPPASRDTQ